MGWMLDENDRWHHDGNPDDEAPVQWKGDYARALRQPIWLSKDYNPPIIEREMDRCMEAIDNFLGKQAAFDEWAGENGL